MQETISWWWGKRICSLLLPRQIWLQETIDGGGNRREEGLVIFPIQYAGHKRGGLPLTQNQNSKLQDCTVTADNNMKCARIVQKDAAKKGKDAGPVSFPVPFGHINYSLSLPEAMGPLRSFPIGWWFYAGWGQGQNQKGLSQQVTMMMVLGRGEVTIGNVEYGIGRIVPGSANTPFVSGDFAGIGNFPAPTPTSWEVSTTAGGKGGAGSHMKCACTSGIVGMPGATYSLEMSDEKKGVSASLKLKDTFGMVLEGAGGGFLRGDHGSFEFAMPSLAIEAGSTVTMDQETTTLSAGSLWLDRQTLSGAVSKGKALYCGNWIPLRMNDGTYYNFLFLWPPKEQQWVVGSELHPSIEPLKKIGLEYPSLEGWDKQTPIQGIKVLESSEFDLNILDTKDPSSSPHWTSLKTGQTYCSAWHMRIRDKTYIVRVLVPNSEIDTTPAFFEGAAIVTDQKEVEVGHCFVEQMGYTQ